jgi:hypothetical protein
MGNPYEKGESFASRNYERLPLDSFAISFSAAHSGDLMTA